MRPTLPLVLALLLAPAVHAQEHAHGGGEGGAMVLHDGPPSGRAVVGGYTHFGFALVGEDGAPVPHQDATFTLTQNGKTLFATTDAHEYDGLFSFDARFARPGPYQVVATSGDMPVGVFEGEAVLPVDETVAEVELVATPQGPASRVIDFELSIVDPAGALIEHTDAIVELRHARDGALFSRTHLHIHDAPIRFSQGFGAPGGYVAHVVAYEAFATERAPDVRAVAAEFPLEVGAVGAPAAPMPELAPPALLEQRGAVASADGLTLHAMYDPNNQVGAGQTARIAGIVLAENGSAIQHVDFALSLAGPRGLAFSTESGHEYDGHFEHLFVPDVPGTYDGAMRASFGETELVVPLHLVVVPPTIPLLAGTGPVEVSVEGLDALVAGEAANVTFLAASPVGPAMHSEVDVTILREGEPPLYQFKLHTHASGRTSAMLQLPEPGTWKMRIDPLPTVPDAALYLPLVVDFEVAQGAEETLPLGAGEGMATAAIPGASVALGLAALAAAAFAARRLR